MNVELLFADEGAREAARRQAVTVIVDALRASATTITALAVGAAGVLPVLTVEEATTYVGRPQHRVAGERQGEKCPGFDHGNSPTELRRMASSLTGTTLVLSTSNGTKMVNTAREGAAAVLMGTTLNARAVARAAWQIAMERQRDIVLVAAGEYGEHAEEDACAARCIAAHLHALGVSCPSSALREETPLTVFLATPSADELRGLGYDEDIDFCAQQDVYDLVPILHEDRFVRFQPSVESRVA
ncbi:MAG: 2-phosphosulfolactate phosphatase [Ardenticatenales bacterium]|nr:2-phosphosulfolactate phosphatase [Ardenticatenales bacterium]